MAINDEVNNLRARMRNIEALIAALVGSEAYFPADEFDEIVYRYFGRGEHLDSRDFYYALRDAIYRRHREEPRSVYERLAKLEQSASLASSGRAESVQHPQETDLGQQFNISFDQLSKEINTLRIEHASLQIDTHSFFVIQSMGLPLNDVPFNRFLPVRVYLSEDNATQIDEVSRAVEKLVYAFGFEISDEFPEVRGSWYKKLYVRSTQIATEPEVVERLKKLERALELQGLDKPQAEINVTEAEAVAKLIQATDKTPNVAIQAGTILFVKLANSQGESCVRVRTLTQRELIKLEGNQELLMSPHTIFHELSKLCNDNDDDAENQPYSGEVINEIRKLR